MQRPWMRNCRIAALLPCLIILTGNAAVAAPAAKAPARTTAAAPQQLSEQEKLDKGLSLAAWVGGWEPDYTKKAIEAMLGYKGLPSLHLYGGVGYADQIFYERTKVYAKGYYFYQDNSYVKLYAGYKDYDYPDDPATQRPNPDSNAYDKVPNTEVEIAHWFTQFFRGSAFIEYFRPTFFHDSSSNADNVKTGVEAYYLAPFDGLRFKVMYALLRDPDPKKTEIKGRNNLSTPAGTATATSVVYRTTDLFGGAVELAQQTWQAEFKYLPNRDLDNSYDYSLLTFFSYRFLENLTGRVDYVYDKYSSESNFAGKTANVFMLSSFYEPNRSITVGAGVKYIDLPAQNDLTGFISLAVKTGVMF